jgi:hypothetical protein
MGWVVQGACGLGQADGWPRREPTTARVNLTAQIATLSLPCHQRSKNPCLLFVFVRIRGALGLRNRYCFNLQLWAAPAERELQIPRLPPDLRSKRRSASRVGCATNLSLPHKPCLLDGCPMFAEFRVHGLNKMGDPDFLIRGTRQRPRVRLSVRKAA